MLRAAIIATLTLPVTLFYARAVADAQVCIVAALFLANRWALRDRTWLQAPHIRLSLIFWAWVVFCTIVAGTTHALGEAVAMVRFFLFAAALEYWVLADADQRRRMFYVIFAAAVWVVIETWQQYFFGTDLVGNARWGSGVLTGPFERARAGPTLQTLFFIAFLPPAMILLDRPGVRARVVGALLLTAAVLTMALIGQRMPMILVIFGLCLTGLIVRRCRGPIALALVVLVLAVAAARFVSPITYETLVVVFFRRMSHFWSTTTPCCISAPPSSCRCIPAGPRIRGFRDNCNDPRYFRVLYVDSGHGHRR